MSKNVKRTPAQGQVIKPQTGEKSDEKANGGYTFINHGGRIMARILKENGIKYSFGVQGGHVHTLDVGFYEQGIKRIHMRHEQSGVYAADALARCTRTPGICFGTAGPGVTNMVSGINQAWLARSPIVAFFGQHARTHNLQHALQEGYGVDMTRTMCKWGAMIDEWRAFPLYTRKALRDCMQYPPGPVVLAWAVETPYWAGKESDLLGDVPNSVKASPIPPAGDPAAVRKLVDILLAAERPVVVTGDGIYWSDAMQELRELVELLQLPVNTRRISRGAVPENHPLSVFSQWRGTFWQEADVLLQIGLQLTNLENFGYAPVWPAKAKRIIVNESPSDGWAPVSCEMEIVGSPKTVLAQMLEYAKQVLKGAKPGDLPNRKPWLNHLRRCRKTFEAGQMESINEAKDWKPVHPFFLGKVVADFLDPSSTVVFDSYTGSAFLTDRFKASYAGQILDAGEAAGVGHGIGMGIGAQLARPGKQVFVMMGDGGIGISGMDIETAARHNLPVVYMIYNDSSWMPSECWDTHYKGQVWPWDMMKDIRYDKMFEPLGCHVENVTEPQQIRSAMERSFNSGKTAVINVIVEGRVPHPMHLTPMHRNMALIAVDPNKVPPETRDLALHGWSPEVEAELRKKGFPPLKSKGKVSRYEMGGKLFQSL